MQRADQLAVEDTGVMGQLAVVRLPVRPTIGAVNSTDDELLSGRLSCLPERERRDDSLDKQQVGESGGE